MLERGIVVSYETIRRWGRKFGPGYAKQIRRRRPADRDVWHLDDVVSVAGRKHWLWRAVDQDGYVLDEIVQARRDTRAAKRLLARLLKKQGLAPKRIVTDKLRSYGAARRDLMSAVEPRSHKGLNNRAENSHVPLRKRERMMQGFRSAGGLQRFISVFSAPKSLRPAAPETLSPRHPHSSDPRDGAVECRGRRNSLRSDKSLVRALMKQRDIAPEPKSTCPGKFAIHRFQQPRQRNSHPSARS